MVEEPIKNQERMIDACDEFNEESMAVVGFQPIATTLLSWSCQRVWKLLDSLWLLLYVKEKRPMIIFFMKNQNATINTH